MARIDESEVLAELARLSKKSDEGLTVSEWAVKLGRGSQPVITLLKRAKAMGWLVVGKQSRVALDNRNYATTVYRIIKPKK